MKTNSKSNKYWGIKFKKKSKKGFNVRKNTRRWNLKRKKKKNGAQPSGSTLEPLNSTSCQFKINLHKSCSDMIQSTWQVQK